MTDTSTANTHARTGLLLIPFAALVLVYLPTLMDLVVDWWQDDNYTHGFLVPLVSGYLVWSVRKELAELRPQTAGAGLVVLLAGMVLFVLGTGAAEYFTARFSFVLSLFGLTWYLLGHTFARRTWFAFFFLCFMIPIPYVIYYAVAGPMQLLASKVTATLLSAIGMGIVRQGNIIHIAGGYSLEVVEACSGIRSLMALLALGALYSYWSQKKPVAQVTLFLSTIPIAVFANVVRVFLTALLASTFVEEITAEPWHTIMGLSVFVVSYLCLAVAGVVIRKVFR
ncbi:MAG: exosortase/archaeosortase family protein [candidate division Zixibacteria bacterium]|nr:exosortase/archaeosortase family protein [candidate division Zixibacteria bacterium]